MLNLLNLTLKLINFIKKKINYNISQDIELFDQIKKIHPNIKKNLYYDSDYYFNKASYRRFTTFPWFPMKASNYPICPQCGGTARPHILMFGDMDYIGHPEQEKNFQKSL